jgi:hypothetical protein
MMKLDTLAEIDGYFTHISPSLDETLMNYDGFRIFSAPHRIASQDGLGDDHIFWPMFREALKSEGVLGVTTLELAVRLRGIAKTMSDKPRF